MTFSEKIRSSREMLEISQTELAEQVGVSRRTIVAYEAGEAAARKSTIAKLARVLKVSTKFLSDENCNDPLADIEKDPYVEQARALYGGTGARDMEALLRDNAALFAGGELSQDEKDAFFEAITQAYFASKNEAKRKFGPKG
jgi:transcriptional regulator with XRE-family HTH domain